MYICIYIYMEVPLFSHVLRWGGAVDATASCVEETLALVYTYTYIYIYIHMHKYMYINTCIHICRYIHMKHICYC
jgi:hypothetical protein